jgi:hypothetical protein
MIPNICARNIRAPTFIKTNTSELKGSGRTKFNNCGQSQHPLSSIDRMSRQKIKKDILELNSTFDKIELADTNRVFHPMTTD